MAVGPTAGFLFDFAGRRIERADTMKDAGVSFSRFVATSFLGHHMQKTRAAHGLEVLQGRDQGVCVVPVDWTDIVEPKFFEKRARHDHAFHVFFPAPRQCLHGRYGAQDRFTAFSDRGIGFP